MEYWNVVTVRKDWKCDGIRGCGKDIRKGAQCWSLVVNTWKNGDNLTIRHCMDCGRNPQETVSK